MSFDWVGSNPTISTNFRFNPEDELNAGMAELADAADLGSVFWEFESLFLYKQGVSSDWIDSINEV